MAIIKISYFPDAKDDKDANASEPLYNDYAPSFDGAEAKLGTMRRVVENDKKP